MKKCGELKLEPTNGLFSIIQDVFFPFPESYIIIFVSGKKVVWSTFDVVIANDVPLWVQKTQCMTLDC